MENKQVYKSEVGLVYYAVMASILVATGISVGPALDSPGNADLVVLTVTLVPVYGLFIWILLTTDYTITPDALKIRCGPLRKTIKRSEIHGITPSKNPLSSPALSLDRLRIDYGHSRFVLVSPKDRPGVYRALGFSPPPPHPAGH